MHMRVVSSFSTRFLHKLTSGGVGDAVKSTSFFSCMPSACRGRSILLRMMPEVKNREGTRDMVGSQVREGIRKVLPDLRVYQNIHTLLDLLDSFKGQGIFVFKSLPCVLLSFFP